MGRRKTTVRKSAGTSRKGPPPPLSQLPLRKWFTTNEFWKSYLDTFSKLPVLKPRYYPRMMRVVATTLQLKDSLDDVGNGEFYLRFWIAGASYTIMPDELASTWGLQNDGIRYKGGNHRPKECDFWKGRETMVLTEEDTFIIRAFVEEDELDWPYLIARRLMRYTDNSWESHLGHSMLWTKVFEHLNLDLSSEEAVEIGEENEITARHVNNMGRGAVAARKGKKSKAVAANVLSHSGTTSNSQITSEAMEVFAESMHAFNIGWDKKMERADRRLKVVEGRIASQAEELQYLEENMRIHLSRNV
ncbi:hypothetical protein PIB30_069607 [Stylosanthes scabra]|uniref:Uncharacterized protein n=1 Tax=Stylosanthes scabra TaxID=79078 RepID=A0ABU6QMS8_9FABA|nr:hypothetical protein [Stylosanthes scabra]